MDQMEVERIYEKIDSMSERQQRLELEFSKHMGYTTSMLEKILEQTSKTNGSVAAVVKKQAEDHKEHDVSIQGLEKWRSKLGGVWAAVLVTGGIIGGVLTLVVTYFAEK